MSINRQSTTPLSVPRSNRNHALTVLTSLPAGKVVPIAAIPMLREDSVRRGAVRIALEMRETAEILLNPVHVQVSAYLVPLLAMERFEGSLDQFNRSFMGRPKVEGGATVPFIETHDMGPHGDNAIYKYLGLHGKPTDKVNTAYLEAYNAIWNFRATNRSKDITKRGRLDKTLAPAFWLGSRFAHIVPDFDQAIIDGEVALNIVDSRMPVRGIGKANADFPLANQQVRESNGQVVTYPFSQAVDAGSTAQKFFIKSGWGLDDITGGPTFPDVYAEMQENGITISLSNIEMAKKTQAFAELRKRYSGHDEDWLIDMLMDGLSIPDQAYKQPMLLAQRATQFRMAKRYATDSGNLDESAVSGMAAVDLRLNVPQLHTGGVIMIVAEVVPEQLFERQRDPFFHLGSVDTLPEFLRDTLDPEKVSVVPNGYIDTDHATPAGTFGYAPLNHEWNTMGPKVGGKFYRPSVNTGFDEARQRLWAVETVNPQLSQNFYIVSDIHTKPFIDQASDPFEAAAIGNVVLNGNTVFGGLLREATDDYDTIAAKAPVARIEKAD